MKRIYNEELGLVIRTNSEFNVQVELYNRLKERISSKFSIFGEVRILGEQKFHGARRQKGRLDIGIFDQGKILCAIEVKVAKRGLKGWKQQENRYLKLGIPTIFLCVGIAQIEQTVKLCEDYCRKYYENKLKNNVPSRITAGGSIKVH